MSEEQEEVHLPSDIVERDAHNERFIREFRANGGVIRAEFHTRHARLQQLLLHTVGAKSGEARVSPLYYLDHQGSWYVVGSFAGNPRAPAWVYNLRANPQVAVELGQGGEVRLFEVTARELDAQEHHRIWPALVEDNGVFVALKGKTDRVMPIFELAR